MAKTEKELQELKKKVEEVRRELKELSDEDLSLVAGGGGVYTDEYGRTIYEGGSAMLEIDPSSL